MKYSVTLAILLTISTLPITTLAATPGECAALQQANPNILCDENTVITDADRAIGISEQVKADKDFLLQNARDLRNSKAPPTCPANIYRLNNTFAVCLSRFIKAADATYGDGAVTVVSAFRSPDANDACGNNAAAGGSATSNHMYGRAADVAPGRGLSYEDLQDFAKANPQLGVCFPYVPRLTSGSFYDAPHMALAGIGTGEARLCAQQGVTNYCDQSPTYDPSEVYNTPTSTNNTNNNPIIAGTSTYPPQYAQYNPYTQGASLGGAYQQYPQQAAAAPYQYPPQPVYAPQPYDPNRYSGIYGAQLYGPTTTKYDRLVEENPSEYEYEYNYEDGDTESAETETLPNSVDSNPPPTSQQYTSPSGGSTSQYSDYNTGDINTPEEQRIFDLYYAQQDDDYVGTNTQQLPPTGSPSPASAQVPEPIWAEQVPSFIEIDNTTRTASGNTLPEFIQYVPTTNTPASRYDDFDPNNRPPEWVDNSFYQPEQTQKSWWGKFISIFGF